MQRPFSSANRWRSLAAAAMYAASSPGYDRYRSLNLGMFRRHKPPRASPADPQPSTSSEPTSSNAAVKPDDDRSYHIVLVVPSAVGEQKKLHHRLQTRERLFRIQTRTRSGSRRDRRDSAVLLRSRRRHRGDRVYRRERCVDSGEHERE